MDMTGTFWSFAAFFTIVFICCSFWHIIPIFPFLKAKYPYTTEPALAMPAVLRQRCRQPFSPLDTNGVTSCFFSQDNKELHQEGVAHSEVQIIPSRF